MLWILKCYNKGLISIFSATANVHDSFKTGNLVHVLEKLNNHLYVFVCVYVCVNAKHSVQH